ncbi:MAG: metallophosphoesterase [Fibrobacter sp.]|jgi:predicted MPP superfamily phosphohydrolase|nr:metallophosphoesterase [Fibrobacter sp.]
MVILFFIVFVCFFFHIQQLFSSKSGRIFSFIFTVCLFSMVFPGAPDFLRIFRPTVIVYVSNFFLLWLLSDLVFLVFRLVNRRPLRGKYFRRYLRILAGFGLVFSTVFFFVGKENNENFRVRHEVYPLFGLQEPLRVLFFSDSHFAAAFEQKKLERLIHVMDSVKPDVIFFGGDLADMSDSALDAEGYAALFRKIKAPLGFYGVTGNHEGYLHRRGTDLPAWMRKNGMILLMDSTVCLEQFCVSGRIDSQAAKQLELPRKPLADFAPGEGDLVLKPWILLDHKPLGITKEDSVSRLPDFAFSGHTHGGQFFPWTLVIGLVWELPAGFGILSGTPWNVSTGFGSWGPPVRIGASTEVLLIDFIPD